jgi:hypothetical protein
MSRVQIRFRLVLPIVFGFLALVLMAWDYENNRMIELMGMGWDTGPPFWPYRAIYVLLFSINAPAFVLSMPILKLLRLQTLSLQYGVWYPAIVGLWWWIGTQIDFGILVRQHFRQAKPLAGVFALASLSFLYGATRITAGEFHWWMEYGQDPSAARMATILRTVGPVLWCLLFACGCALAAVRLSRQKNVPAPRDRREFWKPANRCSILRALRAGHTPGR